MMARKSRIISTDLRAIQPDNHFSHFLGSEYLRFRLMRFRKYQMSTYE
jgi:hypothetical protein